MTTKNVLCDEESQESYDSPTMRSEKHHCNQCQHIQNCKHLGICEQIYHNYCIFIQRTYEEYYKNSNQSQYFNGEPLGIKLIGRSSTQWHDLEKYPVQHAFASFSNGFLVCVKAKYSFNRFPDTVKVMKFKLRDTTYKLLKRYLGPLSDVSSNSEVMAFCDSQRQRLLFEYGKSGVRNCDITTEIYLRQASSSLLWSLLYFLLKQPKNVSQQHIANIIIVNESEFASLKPRQNPTEFNWSLSKRTNSSTPTASQDRYSDTSLVFENASEKCLTSSDINSSIQWCIHNKQWATAFFLESIGPEKTCNVEEMFANSLPYDSPLKTLYEILKSKPLSCLDLIRNGISIDWRPHVVTILSNILLKPNLFAKALLEVGDVLNESGNTAGFVFCYFSYLIYFQELPKDSLLPSSEEINLILLNSIQTFSNHSQSITEIIVSMEIFEYALNIKTSEVQYLKYFLALKMVDYGLEDKAANYLCSIFHCLKEDLMRQHLNLLQNVYVLANRLKILLYSDVQHQKTLYWLIELENLLIIEASPNQNLFQNFSEGDLISSSSNNMRLVTVSSTQLRPKEKYELAIKIEEELQNETNDESLNIQFGSCANTHYECSSNFLKDYEESCSQSINPGNKNITKSMEDSKNNTSREDSKNWLSAVFNKLTLKPKNQMHLPDDSNPTIVWDPDQGRWTNLERSERHENFLTPPKICDLASNSPLRSVEGNLTNDNVYRMQKNRPLKCSYVNVLSPNNLKKC